METIKVIRKLNEKFDIEDPVLLLQPVELLVHLEKKVGKKIEFFFENKLFCVYADITTISTIFS